MMIEAPVESLSLSCRAINCLRSEGLNTIGDYLRLDPEAAMRLPGMGIKTFQEIWDFISVNVDPSICKSRGYDSIIGAAAEREARRVAAREVERLRLARDAEIKAAIANGKLINKQPFMVPVYLCCVPECLRLAKLEVNGLHCCNEHGS